MIRGIGVAVCEEAARFEDGARLEGVVVEVHAGAESADGFRDARVDRGWSAGRGNR